VNNAGGTETKAGGFEVLSDEDWQRRVTDAAAIQTTRMTTATIAYRRIPWLLTVSAMMP
jgi:hypothetical protein